MKSFYSNLIIIKRYYKKPGFSLYLLHKTICMRTSIHIGTLRFYAHHGVLPQEQKIGNYFKVETTLYTDFSRALVTDELTDTLNYAEVCKIISDEMAIPSRLLEHVAGRITNSLRSHYPQITGGRLIVTKEKPPIPGDIRDVSVIVEW